MFDLHKYASWKAVLVGFLITLWVLGSFWVGYKLGQLPPRPIIIQLQQLPAPAAH